MTSLVVYLLMAIGLVGGIVVGVERLKDVGRNEVRALDRAQKAEEDVATLTKTNQILQEVISDASKLLEQREAAVAAAKTKNDQLATDLRKLGSRSVAWLDAPVDPDVQRLRVAAYGTPGDKPGVGLVLHPAEGTGTHPSATVESGNEWSIATGSKRQPGRDSVVQPGQSGRVEPVATPEQKASFLNTLKGLQK